MGNLTRESSNLDKISKESFKTSFAAVELFNTILCDSFAAKTDAFLFQFHPTLKSKNQNEE